ncbi:YicC family protein [bacterium]
MLSMTGFGHASAKHKNLKWDITVTTVNSKYLDIMVLLPSKDLSLEERISRIVGKYIIRGRVEVRIAFEESSPIKNPFFVNKKKLVHCYKHLNNIAKTSGIKERVTFADILHIPYIWEKEDSQQIVLTDKELEKVLSPCLKKVELTRKREGGKLKNKFSLYIARMEKHHKGLMKIASLQAQTIKTRIQKKVTELKKIVDKIDCDNPALEKEITMLLLKGGFEEEIVRISSHINHLKQVIREKGQIGKKMGFIVQELIREFNTLGDKINNTKGKHIVVHVKVELEKIREQLQNVE